MNMTTNIGERGYLDMLARIMAEGVDQEDRTGTGTREIFGHQLRFDCSDGTIPVFTTKRVAWKTCFKEMLWFLSGSPSIKPLLENDVHIWTEWPHAKYVKATGDAIDLKEFERRILDDQAFADAWADSGRAYGVQWRSWRDFRPSAEHPGLFEEIPGGIDQIQKVLDSLRNNPSSRRHIFTGWNVAELEGMMLPPCHMTYQFQVAAGRLSLSCWVRSWDSFLGASFNIAGAALLLRLFAMHTGLKPGELVMSSTCTHIYSNHFEQVAEQLTRTPGPQPRLEIASRDSIFDHRIEDFTLVDYAPQAAISAPVAV